MCYEHYSSRRDAPDNDRLATPRKLSLFLSKLATRHINNYGSITSGLEKLAKGEQPDMSYARVPDDKMKLAAHILSTLAQEDAESRASWVAKVCTIAIESVEDKDTETMTQLVEALESLSENEYAGPPPPPSYDVEALRAQFAGSQVEVVSKQGEEYYTFRGRSAYPAELTMKGETYRLCSASYKKGTYQRIGKPVQPAQTTQPDETADSLAFGNTVLDV